MAIETTRPVVKTSPDAGGPKSERPLRDKTFLEKFWRPIILTAIPAFASIGVTLVKTLGHGSKSEPVTRELAGMVTTEANTSLEGVEVLVVETRDSTPTSSSGLFSLKINTQEKTVHLHISHDGYKPLTELVNVPSSNLLFQLQIEIPPAVEKVGPRAEDHQQPAESASVQKFVPRAEDHQPALVDVGSPAPQAPPTTRAFIGSWRCSTQVVYNSSNRPPQSFGASGGTISMMDNGDGTITSSTGSTPCPPQRLLVSGLSAMAIISNQPCVFPNGEVRHRNRTVVTINGNELTRSVLFTYKAPTGTGTGSVLDRCVR
jgi:hypothetical protein